MSFIVVWNNIWNTIFVLARNNHSCNHLVNTQIKYYLHTLTKSLTHAWLISKMKSNNPTNFTNPNARIEHTQTLASQYVYLPSVIMCRFEYHITLHVSLIQRAWFISSSGGRGSRTFPSPLVAMQPKHWHYCLQLLQYRETTI